MIYYGKTEKLHQALKYANLQFSEKTHIFECYYFFITFPVVFKNFQNEDRCTCAPAVAEPIATSTNNNRGTEGEDNAHHPFDGTGGGCHDDNRGCGVSLNVLRIVLHHEM